ncbi:MAG: protease complex subunit PrcB family protein [Acidobacteria bacterium]|nr:protease complex subunit PrcB family protein [Acidobacteriota bacterium]
MMAFFLMCALSNGGFPLATVSRGAMSSIDEPSQPVVRTQAEWVALWKRHGSGQPLPGIDFQAQMVVGVFLGARPSAGYSVEIVEVRKSGDGLIVEYREAKPGPDRMAAQIVTAPFHLVSLDQQDGAVTFVALKTSSKS